MTPEEARTVTRLSLGGCCVPCVGNLITKLAEELLETPWLSIAAEIDPEAEALKYIESPEEWEA